MKRRITISSNNIDDESIVLDLAHRSMACIKAGHDRHCIGDWALLDFNNAQVNVRKTNAGWAIQVWGTDAAH